MYFWTYGLRNTCLDKCLKSLVLEVPSISNRGNGSKHCLKLNNSTFTIFIDLWEINSGWNSRSEWYPKSYDCLLTHWLPIISILLLTEAIYCNIFRCNYLRNKKSFPNFFLYYLNLYLIFENFQKKGDPHGWCIFELTDSEKRG